MISRKSKTNTSKIILLGSGIILIMASFLLIGMYAIYTNRYFDIIRQECDKYDINYNFCRAIIWTESKYKPDAVSNRGAIGLMQVMPSTATWIAELEGKSVVNLKSPEENIAIGVRYLAHLKKRFSNDATIAAAYNAGEGHVVLWLRDKKYSLDGVTIDKTPYKETNNYMEQVAKTQKIYEFLY